MEYSFLHYTDGLPNDEAHTHIQSCIPSHTKMYLNIFFLFMKNYFEIFFKHPLIKSNRQLKRFEFLQETGDILNHITLAKELLIHSNA